VTRCRVTGFELTGGRLAGVRTERGTIATDACVLAAGPTSGAVAALAGVDLPLHVLRRHKVVLPEVPEVPPDAPLVYDDDTGAHWRAAYRGAVVLAPDADDVRHEPALDPRPIRPSRTRSSTRPARARWPGRRRSGAMSGATGAPRGRSSAACTP